MTEKRLSWTHTPTKTQLFMFSAITWNRHQIHFDKDQAQAEGFPDVAVQRGLIGNFFARALWSWKLGRISRLQWKVTQSAFPGRELRCEGRVTEGTGPRATCELTLFDATAPEDAPRIVATAQAEIDRSHS